MPTPYNNPYIPGDPFSYDLKWIIDQVKNHSTILATLDEKIVELIIQLLDQHDPLYWKTADEMIHSNMKAPGLAYIEGYHYPGDMGGNLYYITSDYNDVLAVDFYITMDGANRWAIPIILTPYVTPQMFGAKANANYYSAGNWYEDADLTISAQNSSDYIQQAVNSKKPVLIPSGRYFVNDPIIINYEGAVVYGEGSEDIFTCLHSNGENLFTIASGYRNITIRNIYAETKTYAGAFAEISSQTGSPDGSVHFLTIENVVTLNFKYGLMIGGRSSTGTADGLTHLWNCSFKNIKFNTHDAGGSNCAVKIFYNTGSNFGLYFERLVTIGYTANVQADGVKAVFQSCNFGINGVNSLHFQTSSIVDFIGTNFECDTKVNGAAYSALINSTYITTFDNCMFISYTNTDTAFLYGGTLTKFTFKGCEYTTRTGDEMVNFFSTAFTGKKYSIEYVGGNHSIPRPTLGTTRSLQILDVENSVLPKQYSASDNGTPVAAEAQYDMEANTGLRPVWFDGSNWKGAPMGNWKYYEDISAGASFTETIDYMVDRPRTVLFCIRGHVNTSYYIGIAFIYRNSAGTTIHTIASNDITMTNSNNVLTFTNTAGAYRYMYGSFIDLF